VIQGGSGRSPRPSEFGDLVIAVVVAVLAVLVAIGRQVRRKRAMLRTYGEDS
jgi:hypothetical protein